MYPFSFKVIGYFSEDNEYRAYTGMGLAENFTDAMKQIENDFGKDLFRIKDLTLYEYSNIIYMPEKCIQDYEASENEIGYECDLEGNAVSVEPIGKEKVVGYAELTPVEKWVGALETAIDEKLNNHLEIKTKIPLKVME